MFQRIPVPTVNLTGIALSPQGTYLSVWDHSLEVRYSFLLLLSAELHLLICLFLIQQYKISIHLPPLNNPLITLPPPPSSSSLPLSGTSSSSPSFSDFPSSAKGLDIPHEVWEDTGLGVRCVAWRPGGKMLAIGGWDGKVILLNSVDWSVQSVLEPIRTASSGMVCLLTSTLGKLDSGVRTNPTPSF